MLEAADGNSFAAFAAMPDEPSATGVVDPAGRPRALPLLRGARAALRRARLPGGRVRLLRPHGRGREARRRLPVHGARRSDDARRGSRPTSAPRSRYLRDAGAASVFTVGFCFGGRNSWLSAAGGHGLAGAVGFYGMPGERNGQPGPTQRAAEIARADPGAPGGRRPEHHRRAQRGVRRGARPRRASSTRSSPTRARRTASSTASSRSTRLRRTDAWARIARVHRALQLSRG